MASTQSGHGATITFGTSTFTAPVTSITPDEVSRDVHDTSHLGTVDYRTKIPGDLVDAAGFSASGWYDTDQQPPITADAETITLTMPDSAPATGGGATIAASGFVDSWSIGEVTTGALIPYEMHVTWAAGPAYVDET